MPFECLNFAAQMQQDIRRYRKPFSATALMLACLLMFSVLNVPDLLRPGFTKTEYTDTHSAPGEAADTQESKDAEKEFSEDVFDLNLISASPFGPCTAGMNKSGFAYAEDLPCPDNGGVNSPPPELGLI